MFMNDSRAKSNNDCLAFTLMHGAYKFARTKSDHPPTCLPQLILSIFYATLIHIRTPLREFSLQISYEFVQKGTQTFIVCFYCKNLFKNKFISVSNRQQQQNNFVFKL